MLRVMLSIESTRSRSIPAYAYVSAHRTMNTKEEAAPDDASESAMKVKAAGKFYRPMYRLKPKEVLQTMKLTAKCECSSLIIICFYNTIQMLSVFRPPPIPDETRMLLSGHQHYQQSRFQSH